jgi:AAA family ATP:ADP antiporter
VPQIKKMLDDPDADVRREALHYIYLKNGGKTPEFWKVHLNHPEYDVRCAALDALSRYGSQSEKRLVTDDVLDEMMKCPHDDEHRGRLLVAGVLGYLKRPQQQRYLKRLLHDSEPQVVRAAIGSVGRLKDREYVPWLINKLADSRFRIAVRNALIGYGRSTLGTLTDYLFDENVPLTVRRNIPRVMADIPLQLSVDTLTDALNKVEPSLKYYVLKGLNRLRTHHSELKFPTKQVDQSLIAETRIYYEILLILRATRPKGDDEASKLLKRALKEKQEQNMELIFRLLGLSYPPRDIYSAYQGIVSRKQALRSSAVEFLDNLLRNNIKRYLFPILDEVSPDTVARKGEELFGIRFSDREEALEHLINGRDPWLKAVACFCAGRMRSERLIPLVEEALDDPDPVVRETAEWTVRRGAVPGV